MLKYICIVTILIILALFTFRDNFIKVEKPLPRFHKLEDKNNYTCHKIIGSSLAGYNNPQRKGIVAEFLEASSHTISVELKNGGLHISGNVIATIQDKSWQIVKNTDSHLIAVFMQSNALFDPIFTFILDKNNGVATYTENYAYLFESNNLITSSAYFECQ